MKINVLTQSGPREIVCTPGAKLLEYFRSADIFVNSACGGKGSCQKCRVQVTSGHVGISNADRKAFQSEDLERGWRLSCQVVPRMKIEVRIPEVEDLRGKPRVSRGTTSNMRSPRLVCDMGSTGIVLALVNDTGEEIAEAHVLNRQIKFGSDVMTRLQFAMENKGEELQKVLLDSLLGAVDALRNVFPNEVLQALNGNTIICAGNSAMTSLIHRWPIESLATNPFQPSYLESAKTDVNEIVFETLPLLGGFVGGDTFAGVFYLESINAEKPWMMVDIGTNTEIVLATKEGKYIFASAPAGPAFEGGNITKGMRAEPGAITHAKFDGNTKTWKIETVGGDLPRGICGSGLIDLISESLSNNLLTTDGYMEQTIQVIEDIELFADDIREFQLAKSATRTGCDIVVDRAKVKPSKIYLAGTFAQHINVENLDRIGLLPAGIAIEQIGNASLKGTIKFLVAQSVDQINFMQKLNSGKEQIELALQEDFQELFVGNLNFI